MWRILLAACALVGGACFCVANARASCDATGTVCDYAVETGDCAAGDGAWYRTTYAQTPVGTVQGTSDCYYASGYGSSDNTISASTVAGSLVWGSFAYDDFENGHFEGCFVYVSVGIGVYESCPAAASPPDPGWGHLLP